MEMNRPRRISFTLVVSVLLLLGIFGGVASAQWSDLTPGVLSDYQITESEVSEISDGFSSTVWGPYQEMPRKQFVKMAVDTFALSPQNPVTPTFADVPTDHQYYPYVEAAAAAGLVEGTSSGVFEPETIITREQGAAIIIRPLAEEQGVDLGELYDADKIADILGPFDDDDLVGPNLRDEVAAAVDCGIVEGTVANDLNPKQPLLRIQGAAMLIRSDECVIPLPLSVEVSITPEEAANPVTEDSHELEAVLSGGDAPDPGGYYFVWSSTGYNVDQDLTGTGEDTFVLANDPDLADDLEEGEEGVDTITLQVFTEEDGQLLGEAEATKNWYISVAEVCTAEWQMEGETTWETEATADLPWGATVDFRVQFTDQYDNVMAEDWSLADDHPKAIVTVNPGTTGEASDTVAPASATIGSGDYLTWSGLLDPSDSVVGFGPGDEVTVQFFLDADDDGVVDSGEIRCPETPFTFTSTGNLTISPEEDTNFVDDDHTVTAVGLPATGDPADYYYEWLVNGTEELAGFGEDSLTYAYDGQFEDTITLNVYPGDPSDTGVALAATAEATKYWIQADDVTIAPEDDVNLLDADHPFTVTLPQELDDEVLVGYDLYTAADLGVDIGDAGDPLTPVDGEVSFTAPAQPAGDYTIAVTVYDADDDSELVVVETTKEWSAVTATITPQDATNPVDVAHDFTVEVTPEALADDVEVGYELWASGDNTVNIDGAGDPIAPNAGTAGFAFTAPAPQPAGDYTIEATVYDAVGGGDLTTVEATKTWQDRTVNSVTLTPDATVNAAGEDHTVTATVVDQFDAPMSGVTVDFTWSLDVSENGTATDFTSSASTDSSGEATSTWSGASEWGPADITASAGGVTSGTVTKYWAMQETALLYSAQDLTVPASLSGGDATLNVTLGSATGTSLATGIIYDDNTINTYSDGLDLTVSATDEIWIEFVGSGSGFSDWVYDMDGST